MPRKKPATLNPATNQGVLMLSPQARRPAIDFQVLNTIHNELNPNASLTCESPNQPTHAYNQLHVGEQRNKQIKGTLKPTEILPKSVTSTPA
jgi:hypothetical protein